MALDDRDRRALADIVRQVRADDPEFAAALTGPPREPQPDWAPIHLRVLVILLIVVGALTSTPVLVLAALVVFGVAQLSGKPSPSRVTTAGGDDGSQAPHGS